MVQVSTHHSKVEVSIPVTTTSNGRGKKMVGGVKSKNGYHKTTVKLYLHWRRLRDNAGDSDSHYLLALATLGGMT